MARQRYRGNTLSASFPLLSSFSGQTVIVPGIDQFYMRGAQIDHQQGIPEVVFMENVMPMANGLQSVGFSQKVVGGLETDFDRAFYLRDSSETKTLFVPANGKNYTYNYSSFNWNTQFVVVPFDTFVSIANIKGRQFVCYANHFVFEWDGALLNLVDLLGLDITTIRGIVAAGAYLIAYTEDRILWSSILDPTDFVPSEENFAGGTDVLSIKGNIVCCTPISDGFIIWTTANTVVALYTANSRFPWTFKEIAGSAGIDSVEKVSDNSTDIQQFAATVSGIMTLNRSQATQIWPEVTEFFAARRYESFNFSTKKVEEFDINTALLTKLNFIASRYVVLSYGADSLTHALIYDAALKRWGKVRVDHVDCFEFVDQPTTMILGSGLRYMDLVGTYENQTQTYAQYGRLVLGPAIRYQDLQGSYEAQPYTYLDYGGYPIPGVFIDTGQEPLKSIGFLQRDGAVKTLNFDLPAIEIDSILSLGRYQLSRGRMTVLHEVWIENVSSERTAKLAILRSFDGFNTEPKEYLYKDKDTSRGRLQKYFYDGPPFMNCILQLEGNHDLNSIEMVWSPAGYR